MKTDRLYALTLYLLNHGKYIFYYKIWIVIDKYAKI